MLHEASSIHRSSKRGTSMRPIVINPAQGTSFALMEGRPILFSESSQKIYELNRVGAYIWCKMLEQRTVKSICDELAGLGISQSRARHFVREAIYRWIDLRLIDVHCGLSADYVLQANLARHTISVRASNKQLLERVAPLFCSAGRGTGRGDTIIEVIELEDQVLLRGNETELGRCRIEELAPTIKTYLAERVILHRRTDVALHAASLVKDGKGLLICGQPGAGKSTLTCQLLDAGFQYGGDDVVLIRPDERAEGIAFAPTIKPGSWGMVAKLRADLENAVVHQRSDGVRVRYLPIPDPYNESFSIHWIVFLNRVQGVLAELKPLGQIESMGRVISGSFAANGKLSREAFVSLNQILAHAKAFELAYSDAVQARHLLADLCHGQS